MAMAFLQRPGQTTFDTKFDLTADVQRFLVESLSLWKQDSNFGELQNQAYGYLFPQGAFFLLGESLGIADWVVQRLTVEDRAMREDELVGALVLPSGTTTELSLEILGMQLPVARLDSADAPVKMQFVRQPRPREGEAVSTRAMD